MKKMWKKVVAVAVSMTMVLAMGLVVNASESVSANPSQNPSQPTTPSNPGQDTGDNGQSPVGSVSAPTLVIGDVSVDENSGVTLNTVEGKNYADNQALIESVAGIKEILGNNYKTGTTLSLLAYVDISPLRRGVNQVTVSVKGVAKNDTIYVLHYNVTNYNPETEKVEGNWEVITPDAVGDGTVTFTCDSFSPFAFVKATSTTPAKTPAKTSAKSTNKNSTTTKKSPKTGEF